MKRLALAALALCLASQPALADKKFSAADYIEGRNVLQGLDSGLLVFLPTGKVAKTLSDGFFTAQMHDRLAKAGLKILAPDKDDGSGVALSQLARPTFVFKVSTLESAEGLVIYYAELQLREGIMGSSMASKRKMAAAMPVIWSRGGMDAVPQAKLQKQLSTVLDQLLVIFVADYQSANK